LNAAVRLTIIIHLPGVQVPRRRMRMSEAASSGLHSSIAVVSFPDPAADGAGSSEWRAIGMFSLFALS
jgi:hypothetical protein